MALAAFAVVVVLALPLNVTVIEGFPPRMALHGFVVLGVAPFPQVLDEKFAALLH